MWSVLSRPWSVLSVVRFVHGLLCPLFLRTSLFESSVDGREGLFITGSNKNKSPCRATDKNSMLRVTAKTLTCIIFPMTDSTANKMKFALILPNGFNYVLPGLTSARSKAFRFHLGYNLGNSQTLNNLVILAMHMSYQNLCTLQQL